MSEITKEEIAIMIDVQSKSVINLEKIANSLKDTVDEQKALNLVQKQLLAEFTSGVVVQKLDLIDKTTSLTRNMLSTIGIVIAIAYIIVKIFNI